MHWLAGSSVRARGLVLAVAAAVIVVGVVQVVAMPVDVLPEFGPPAVEIQTESLGLSALEVEQLITAPMEQNLLNGVAFVSAIRSESMPGLSSIELIFEPGTDALRARQVVQERLIQARAALPQVSKPPQILQPVSSLNRVMAVGVSSKTLSLIETSVLARWTIRPRLMGVTGVAGVAIWGQRERQLQVQVDPRRLREAGVTLDQVIATAGNALWVSPLTFLEASTPGSGGFIDTPNQRVGIQHILPITTPEHLAQVTMDGCAATAGVAPSGALRCRPTASSGDATPQPTVSGPPLRIGDVATVVEEHQPLIGDGILTDGPGLVLVIEKLPNANVIDVTRGIESALKGLTPALSGVKLDPTIFRSAGYIETSTDNLRRALLIGLALLVAGLAALLFNWRTVVICLVSITVSVVAAGLVLVMRGTTINLMVFAGLVLALAVIVADAVGDTDSISRQLRRSRADGGRLPTSNVIAEASVSARVPVAYATAAILLVLLPLVALDGESGAFLPPIALSYAGAILVSTLVALTVTPALSSLLPPRKHRREPPIVRWLGSPYQRLVSRLSGTPRLGLAALGVLLVVGVALVPFLSRGSSLVPVLKDSNLLIRWEATPGTSLGEMNRITARAANELRTLPGIRSVAAHVGRAVMSDRASNVNAAEIWIALNPAADYEASVASTKKVVDGYPGLNRAVLNSPNQRITEILTDGDRDLTVRINGPDLEVLRSKGDEVRGLLSRVAGVTNTRIDAGNMEPTLEVTVNLGAAQRYGVKPGDVRRAAATLLSGIEVGSIFEEQKVFDVVVRGKAETLGTPDALRELLVDTPSGVPVRIGDVADVRIAPNPTSIRHEAVSRFIDVSADIRGRSIGTVVRDVESRLQAMRFPIEHHAEVRQARGEGSLVQSRFAGIVIAALLGVYLLLQAAFSSWRLATAVLVALLAALAGGVVAVLIDGEVVSIGTIVGFFAVFAVATRDSITSVVRWRGLEQPGGEGPLLELISRGARERLQPVLTTAVVTALALLPLVIASNEPGHEIVRPMAVVVIGGLVTSTLVVLLVLPGLYALFGPQTSRRKAHRDATS